MNAARDPAFEDLLEYLKTNRGFDFTGYKRPSLMRRVDVRMQTVGEEDYRSYRDYLEVHPDEFAYLFNTILINVTSFFRDPEAWEYVAETVLPGIIDGKGEEGDIRVWSAGCASGEEPYSIAMLLAEAIGMDAYRSRVKIYATDVDEDALTRARQATYTPEQMEAVPDDLRERYFALVGGSYVLDNDLRRGVVFGRHDLVQDAPISRLDLLVCRNTLIYFNAETQRHILARFHFALKDEGCLFLGKAELMLTHAHLFDTDGLKYHVFERVPQATLRDRMVVLAQAGDADAAAQLGTYVRLREVAFQSAPVAQAVVDRDGTLALANEALRDLFQLQARDVGRPLQDLELSYRPIELRSLIDRAYTERAEVRAAEVERPRRDEPSQYLDIHVTPLRTNGMQWLGVNISFVDVTELHTAREEIERTAQELETAYEEVQSTNEELETTNEELQSSNEELQTTNEELQSTNEEMETMNEELQSTNEELQAMNTELQQRTMQLDQANLFLESILGSLQAGVVVVDRDLDVLLWNRRAEDLWGLRAEEVEGRSFLNLDIGLPVGELRKPLHEFLEGSQEERKVETEAVNRRGKAIRCHITLNCLHRGRDDVHRGIVLLMEEELLKGEA
jgi:two-component system CheB/CheR fusion protein